MGRMTLLDIEGVAAPSVEKYQLKHIKPYHREIARRVVLGQSQHDIAQDLSMSESRLSIICNSPMFKKEVERLESMRNAGVENIQEQLQEVSPVMLEILERLALYSSKDQIKKECAQDLLDRAGYGKITKFDGTVTHETHEQKLARLTGQVGKMVDVTPKKGN